MRYHLKSTGQAHRRGAEDVVSIHLGENSTAAVHVQKAGDTWTLLGYVVRDPFTYDEQTSMAAFVGYFQGIVNQFKVTRPRISITLPGRWASMKQLEIVVNRENLPGQVRQKMAAALKQDLTGHVVGTHFLPQARENQFDITEGSYKNQLLAAAAPQCLVQTIVQAAQRSGALAQIIPALACQLNSLKVAYGHIFEGENVMVLSLAGGRATLAILDQGRLSSLEDLALRPEEIKPLTVFEDGAYRTFSGRPPAARDQFAELVDRIQAARAAFETPDRKLKCLFVAGELVPVSLISFLKDQLSIPCRTWDPLRGFILEISESQKLMVHEDECRLAPALGGAIALLSGKALSLNLLGDPSLQVESPRARRHDALLYGALAMAACAILLFSLVTLRQVKQERQIRDATAALRELERQAGAMSEYQPVAETLQSRLGALNRFTESRFFLSPVLNYFQNNAQPRIKITQLIVDNVVTTAHRRTGLAPIARTEGEPPTPIKEKCIVLIQGRNYGDVGLLENFMAGIRENPYFQNYLSKTAPLRLKNSVFLDGEKGETNNVSLFTLECNFKERGW